MVHSGITFPRFTYTDSQMISDFIGPPHWVKPTYPTKYVWFPTLNSWLNGLFPSVGGATQFISINSIWCNTLNPLSTFLRNGASKFFFLKHLESYVWGIRPLLHTSSIITTATRLKSELWVASYGFLKFFGHLLVEGHVASTWIYLTRIVSRFLHPRSKSIHHMIPWLDSIFI
jgi:hypothetical protein